MTVERFIWWMICCSFIGAIAGALVARMPGLAAFWCISFIIGWIVGKWRHPE